jgi:hypothetical protein
VARIALASALTRLGRESQAVTLFSPLLDQAYRDGNWPQMWTALRIVAELLWSALTGTKQRQCCSPRRASHPRHPLYPAPTSTATGTSKS